MLVHRWMKLALILAAFACIVMAWRRRKSADALGWLSRHGNPFFASIQDADGRLAIDLGVYGAPETFVIDAQGVIRFKHVGALTDEVIRTRIVPLLEAGR